MLTSVIIKLGHDSTLKIIVPDDRTEFKLSPYDQCSTTPFGEIKFTDVILEVKFYQD